MAAVTAAKKGDDVTLIEKNEKIGKKLYISGKGRCNVTNDCEPAVFLSNVITNPKFLTGALYSFSPSDTMRFFEENGLTLKVERGNRVFPASDKSSDVIKTFNEVLNELGVTIRFNEKVTSIVTQNYKAVGVTTDKGRYYADKIIVATGGNSYQSTGSTGDGYGFAKSVGHSITPLLPALSPLYTKFGYRDIAGLSLKNVTLKVCVGQKTLFEEFGEMLFTHEGISGPIVLTVSSKINRLDLNDIDLFIDFKPALSDEQLDKRVLRDFEENPIRQLKNSFDQLLPKRMIDKFLVSLGLDKYKKVCEVTKEERKKIVGIMKNFPIDKIRRAPIDQAIVTSGGVNVNEIDPKTMRSKIVDGLYFVGEVLDVDALTGGFNIQIALSTGAAAGRS